jgi:hypothetical protein
MEYNPKEDYDALVHQIQMENYQIGNAELIPGWHQLFKIKPISQGGTMSGYNIIKVDPQQHFTLLWMQTLMYPNDSKLQSYFKLLKDEYFATTAEEYELAKSPNKLRYDINARNTALIELVDSQCAFGDDYEDARVTKLKREINEKNKTLGQALECIAEMARCYKHNIKGFEKPVAPHIQKLDREFDAYQDELNPTMQTKKLGTSIQL